MTRLDPMSPLAGHSSPGRQKSLLDVPLALEYGQDSHESASSLRCPIGLFHREETDIEAATRKINAAFSLAERALYARAIVEATKVLTSCIHFDPASLHCRLCQNFSQLRARTAEIIVQAGSCVAMRGSEDRDP